jgi:nucleoside-diphosphate-sugar epimerase
MRITVFGAAGNVGSRVVAEGLSRGHEVTAVVRDPARLHELPAAANARAGNAGHIEDVVELSPVRRPAASANSSRPRRRCWPDSPGPASACWSSAARRA